MSKGSRQDRVVSSVEGLALKAGIGRFLEVRDVFGVDEDLRVQVDKRH